MKILQSFVQFLLAYVFLVASVGAQNLITTQAYWEDPTGTASFTEAREQRFTPYEGVLNRGYTASTTWLRLRIDHQTGNAQDRHIVLRVLPNFLDEVELFDPLDPRDKPRIVGDLANNAEQEYPSLAFGFAMPVGNQDRDVWLRVRNVNMKLIQIDAYGESAMLTVEKYYLTTTVICLGLMLFLGLFNLFNWLWQRDWLYTVFVFRTFFLVLILTAYFGVARNYLFDWIEPEWLDNIFNVGVLLTLLFSCYFEFGLLSEYGLKRWALWPQRLICIGMLICFVLYGLGQKHEAMSLCSKIAFFMFLSLFCVALAGLKNSVPRKHGDATGIHRMFFYVYYLLIIGSHPWMQEKLFSLLNQPPQVLIMMAYYAIISSIAMTLIVQFRAAKIRKSQHHMQSELALLDERIKHERLRREEQGNLLSMLMHEVRTPLAVIELSQNHNRHENIEMVRRNAGIIRSVLDRILKLEKINDERLQIEKSRFLLSDCLAQAIDDVSSDDHSIVLADVPDEYIHTDFECLLTILVNLLGNALKYSAPYQPVRIEIEREALPDQLSLTVINRIGSCGTPDPDQVFHKYYRGEGAKKLPGTGVGLFLVQQLAMRLGGTCHYTSDAEWVRFKVIVPTNRWSE